MTTTQDLAVPDWVPGNAGSIASPSWTSGNLGTLTSAGLHTGSSSGDVVVLLGAANTTDPIGPDNPNVLGTFIGGVAYQPAGPAMTACAAYAVLRYPPPVAPGTASPTSALVLELQGSG